MGSYVYHWPECRTQYAQITHNELLHIHLSAIKYSFPAQGYVNVNVSYYEYANVIREICYL